MQECLQLKSCLLFSQINTSMDGARPSARWEFFFFFSWPAGLTPRDIPAWLPDLYDLHYAKLAPRKYGRTHASGSCRDDNPDKSGRRAFSTVEGINTQSGY